MWEAVLAVCETVLAVCETVLAAVLDSSAHSSACKCLVRCLKKTDVPASAQQHPGLHINDGDAAQHHEQHVVGESEQNKHRKGSNGLWAAYAKDVSCAFISKEHADAQSQFANHVLHNIRHVISMQVLGDTRSVFDVPADLLLSLCKTQSKSNLARDMMHTTHSLVLSKFCDVCRYLNIDPLDTEALPVVVIFMCKSKHCSEIAEAYLQACGREELLQNLCISEEHLQDVCDGMLNSMADWLVLFSFLDIKEHDARNHGSVVLAKEKEQNDVLRRMQTSLTEAQVMPSGSLAKHKISMHDTALLALLYLSPRKAPSGKMLELLYTEINEQARDAELRCLRAMTAFKDTMDDERAYADTMPLVLRSMRVRENFAKSIGVVLRKQLNDADGMRYEHSQAITRPLLRTYAQNSVANKKLWNEDFSWRTWRESLCFPPTTSSQMQTLLYFISVQEKAPSRVYYERHYTKDICDKAAAHSVELIDAGAIVKVIQSLRLYQFPIKHLIDFSSKCLQGINQKTRQSLPVVKILQLYIASYQREYVWKEIWREIVPVVNYTIIDDVKRFVTSNTYDVDTVVQNLLHSQIDN